MLDIPGTAIIKNRSFVILVDQTPFQIPVAHLDQNTTITYQF